MRIVGCTYLLQVEVDWSSGRTSQQQSFFLIKILEYYNLQTYGSVADICDWKI